MDKNQEKTSLDNGQGSREKFTRARRRRRSRRRPAKPREFSSPAPLPMPIPTNAHGTVPATEWHARSGIDGQFEITRNAQGAEIARLRSAHATAEVALYGAQLLSYLPVDQVHDVLWMGQYAPEEGKDCWGGIPLCWPWFMVRKEPPHGPFHGFGRFSHWEVCGVEAPGGEMLRVRLGLWDTEKTREIWPHAFAAELVISLNQRLDLELRTRNTGDAPFTLEHCFHSYFRVGDVTRIRILGLEGGETQDNSAPGAPRFRQEGPLLVPGHIARVVRGAADMCRIEDPAWGRTLVVEKRGSPQTVVWNSGPVRTENGRRTGEPEWQTQIAVEALRGLEEAVTVAPGAEVSLGMSVWAEPLTGGGQ